MSDSTINILKHNLVPEHVVLTPEEEEAFLVQYKINRYNLPLIKTSDPVIKMLEEEQNISLKGRIIKIIRTDSPAGEGIYYRYVIE